MRQSTDTSLVTHCHNTTWWVWAMLAFAIPFQLQSNYAINAFYAYGANYRDAGWFARLLWHNSWRLINPHDDASYLVVHFTPWFIPLTYLSSLLPTHAVEFYSTLLATTYAGLAVVMYFALCACMKPKTHWHLSGLAVVAIGFSFTGFVMQGIQLLHYEYAIPLFVCAFLLALACDQMRLAIGLFVATLSIREDAGFHMAAILGLLCVVKYAKDRSLSSIRREAAFLGGAIAYGGFAWWITFHLGSVYRIPGSAFEIIYTGSPPYAHLSWHKLAGRLQAMFADKVYGWAPVLVTLLWAARTRNPYLAIGFCASLPWFLLNWTAAWDGAGVLYSYYSFPFVVVMAWPVLATLLQYGSEAPPNAARETLALQILVVVLGLVAWNPESKAFAFGPDYLGRFGSFRLQNETETRDKIREFDRAINDRPYELGTIMADEAIMSLVTDPNRRVIEMGRETKADIDTIAYFRDFAPQRYAVRDEVHARHLPFHYCVASTKVCLFTDRAPPSLRAFSGVLTPLPADIDSK